MNVVYCVFEGTAIHHGRQAVTKEGWLLRHYWLQVASRRRTNTGDSRQAETPVSVGFVLVSGNTQNYQIFLSTPMSTKNDIGVGDGDGVGVGTDSDMEIQLSFDENGRTRCDDSEKLDYTAKARSTSLSSLSFSVLDDLLYDAEIADCALLPRTFWMPADGEDNITASCWMEQLAQQVFQHHTRDSSTAISKYDATTSGAEWWVQIRPSPPSIGRYAVLSTDNEDSTHGNHDATHSVSFHWDKDEDLRILAGGNLYVHPHISTVTYITDLGAPTIVMEDYRINTVTGEWIVPDQQPKAILSWPRTGKHLSFDGRLLHAAPFEFMNEGMWNDQIHVPKELEDSVRKVQSRRHRRVTFLVNIWLNYKPFNINRFPMPEKMTKCKPDFTLFQGHNLDKVKEIVIPASARIMSWPLGGGDSREVIQMKMDSESVQVNVNDDGVDTIQLTWEDRDGVVMTKGEETTISDELHNHTKEDIGKKRHRSENDDDTTLI